MLSRDSVHLSELQRDPKKYVKYKFLKKTVFLSPEIVKWNSFMFFLLMMMNSASASLQVLWMWPACISLDTFQRTLRVSGCIGQRLFPYLPIFLSVARYLILRGNVRRPRIDRYNERKRYPTNRDLKIPRYRCTGTGSVPVHVKCSCAWLFRLRYPKNKHAKLTSYMHVA